jgi:hypothetical protein
MGHFEHIAHRSKDNAATHRSKFGFGQFTCFVVSSALLMSLSM